MEDKWKRKACFMLKFHKGKKVVNHNDSTRACKPKAEGFSM